jgi:glycosyltransferase involved in cell wall biosynthesis
MIKVLHILPSFGPAGAESMAVSLMRTLDRERFEVGAISLFDPSGTELEGILAQEGVPVWYLGKRRGFDPRMFVRVARTLEHIRPHVVHTHLRVLRYVLPYMFCRRIPAMIHTVHNLSEREVDWPGRLVHRMAFRRGVLPVAIAEAVADSLRRCYGIDGFPLIPNGIPVGAFRQPLVGRDAWRRKEGFAPTDVIFACVGGLRPQKNPALLLESFAREPALDPRAHLLFIGRGKLRPDLERRVGALGLQERVHLVGVRSDVPETLNAIDVFVLSSDWEGNPLSVMEAMAAGKPVICTAVGGVPELVGDGEECGLLVPRRDAKALAQAMQYLLENPEARDTMGKASATRAVENFDLSVMAEAYEKLYRAVIAKTQPPSVTLKP